MYVYSNKYCYGDKNIGNLRPSDMPVCKYDVGNRKQTKV